MGDDRRSTSSYNLIGVNLGPGRVGNWSCENHDTLRVGLKERLNFTGFVMSDWTATHSASVAAGLDQEMPGAGHMNNATLGAMVQQGAITEDAIDDSARRILWPLFAVGAFDKANNNTAGNNVRSAAGTATAFAAAMEGTVLLQNDGGLLPIQLEADRTNTAGGGGIRTIAVIGRQAQSPIYAGGGSGAVSTSHVTSPLSAIEAHVAAAAAPSAGVAAGAISVVYSDGQDLANATATAAAADVVLVFVGTGSREGADRGDLTCGEDALVTAVAKSAGKAKTAVVAVTPGALLTDWRADVAAVLVPFMPGEEYGNAVAALLFGDASPSGRLPITFPAVPNEMEMSQQQWPGLHSTNNGTSINGSVCVAWTDRGGCNAVYSERLEVGYRWYAAHPTVKPAFPFGHGLTFTQFSYSALVVDKPASTPSGVQATVSFTLTNVGKVAGKETPQLYLQYPAAAGEPPLQLRGFDKVELKPGAARSVSFALDARSFSVWDPTAHGWKVVTGTYTVAVGASSGDLRLHGTVAV